MHVLKILHIKVISKFFFNCCEIFFSLYVLMGLALYRQGRLLVFRFYILLPNWGFRLFELVLSPILGVF